MMADRQRGLGEREREGGREREGVIQGLEGVLRVGESEGWRGLGRAVKQLGRM